MLTVDRLRDDLRQLGRAFREPRVRYTIGLFALAFVAVGLLRLFYPAVFPALVSDLLISVLGAVFGVYISLEVLLPYVRHVERARIAPAAEIVDHHDAPESFLHLAELPGARPAGVPRRIPVTAEHLPATLRSYDAFAHDLVDEQYRVPDELAGLYEPDRERLAELFRREGRTNGRKVRLESVADDRFALSTTTYYRSFLTNFCPDYELSGGTTLRALTEPLLFDGDEPRPLAATPFSDHFGGGGLVVTTDGRALLPVRSRSVAVEGKALHLSFSGSFDVETVAAGGVGASLRAILDAELAVEERRVRSLTYLGTTRRIERLGKPDTVALALVDADADLTTTTDQFVNGRVVEVLPGAALEEAADLFAPDVARTVLENLLAAIDDAPYRPSLGLLSFLWLYWGLVERRAGEQDEAAVPAVDETRLRSS